MTTPAQVTHAVPCPKCGRGNPRACWWVDCPRLGPDHYADDKIRREKVRAKWERELATGARDPDIGRLV